MTETFTRRQPFNCNSYKSEKMKSILKFVVASFIGGAIAFATFKYFDRDIVVYDTTAPSLIHQTSSSTPGSAFDFTKASEIATPAVVHIKASNEEYVDYQSGRDRRYNDPWDFFFYDRNRERPQAGSGSGVITSADGYIVTNNHVVGYADFIKVTLYDGREVNAKKIGTDSGSDLAVIKIEADDLPYLRYGDSEDVKIGQWVVAVGNPFDLESTVTAGIISAIGRDLNLLNKGKRHVKTIEEFLQTDAVVNPGNSGGALVDIHGNLIGINTAISSPTGYYAGYSFAIPSNIVKRVVAEIIENGDIQRAYLGVNISEMASGNQEGLTPGVYVADFTPNSSARVAGIKRGDRIVGVDSQKVVNFENLTEALKFAKVGDVFKVSVVRSGNLKKIDVKLRKGI